MTGRMADGITITGQPFEAEFLGAPAWRLDLIERKDPLALGASLTHLLATARRDRVALIVCRVPEGNRTTQHALLAAGFRPIETLVTFEKPIESDHGALPEGVAIAVPQDHAACRALGRIAFQQDRMHLDPNIPNALADAAKERWVDNALRGRAETALVVRDGDHVAGFNLLLRRGTDAIIDLIAVDPRHQGRGFGATLISAALAQYSGRADRLVAATQSVNEASMGLYRRCGFRPIARDITLHWTP